MTVGTERISMSELMETARQTKAWACYDCGKCTGTCPISRAGGDYSPRRHVLATNLGHGEELMSKGSMYQCLTCGTFLRGGDPIRLGNVCPNCGGNTFR